MPSIWECPGGDRETVNVRGPGDRRPRIYTSPGLHRKRTVEVGRARRPASGGV